MLIAHLTDLHIVEKGKLANGISETNLEAEHAINALMRLDPQPNCLIISGDITETGTEAEYAMVADLLAPLPFPVYCIPGNHDGREQFRKAFSGAAYVPMSGAINFTIDLDGVRIIALDSTIEGQSYGALSPDTLTFLREGLRSAPETPTLVMLHHPPIATGIDHMDGMALQEGSRELQAIVAANPQVERVLCGHVHRAIQRRFAGTICQIAPSVTQQVVCDLRPNGPAAFSLEPGSFLLHHFDDGACITHMVPVHRAPGPFRFYDTSEVVLERGEFSTASSRRA